MSAAMGNWSAGRHVGEGDGESFHAWLGSAGERLLIGPCVQLRLCCSLLSMPCHAMAPSAVLETFQGHVMPCHHKLGFSQSGASLHPTHPPRSHAMAAQS